MNIIRRLSAVLRRTGRTEKALVGFFTSPDAIFVVATEHQAEELRRQYPAYKNRITSLGQVERQHLRFGRVPIIYDHSAVEFELDKLFSIIQELRVKCRIIDEVLGTHDNKQDTWLINLTNRLKEAREHREREKRKYDSGPQMARHLTDLEIFDALEDMYRSEINFKIETFWDSGFYPQFGNTRGGYVGEECFETFLEAARWLVDRAFVHYPKSVFTKKWTIPHCICDLEETT